MPKRHPVSHARLLPMFAAFGRRCRRTRAQDRAERLAAAFLRSKGSGARAGISGRKRSDERPMLDVPLRIGSERTLTGAAARSVPPSSLTRMLVARRFEVPEAANRCVAHERLTGTARREWDRGEDGTRTPLSVRRARVEPRRRRHACCHAN